MTPSSYPLIHRPAALAVLSGMAGSLLVVDFAEGWYGVANFVEYTLDDGTTVVFESAEADLVSLRRGGLDAADGGPLATKLAGIAKAAGQVARAVGAELRSDELAVQLGVKVAGEVNAWFFAKSQAEATITLTATWKKDKD